MSGPRAIGPYEVVGSLGEGGMGRVLEVRHPDLPGRRLALKLVRARDLRPEPRRRLVREAERLARVHHPGVVRVHAAGELPEGPYLVMDLVEGETLAELLTRRGSLPPEEAGALALRLAEALAALHAAGLVHRDLKPGNVLIRPDGSPVLIDFGLAWAADVERLTRTGALVGTPYFLPPELLDGSPPGPSSPTLDVWGLGTLLHALLSGRGPFEDSSSFLEAARRITTQEPEWPAAPAPLLRVLRRALAKRPQDRQPDARVFAEELRAALSGADQQRPPRRLLWGGLVGALLAAGGAAALLSRQSDPPRPARASPSEPGGQPPIEARPAPSVAEAPGRAPLRWSRLELPWSPPRAAGIFLPGGRILAWEPRGSGPGRLVEWGFTPPAPPAPSGRSWELPGPVDLLDANAAGLVLLSSDRALLRLDLAPGGAARLEPLQLGLELDGARRAMALAPDGGRVALAVTREDGPERVIVLQLSPSEPRAVLDRVFMPRGRFVSSVLLDEDLIVASYGSVGENCLERTRSAGGDRREVPTTTVPVLVWRDPQGRPWVATESYYLHEVDFAAGTVAPQLSGVGARSHMDTAGGLVLPPSHSGVPLALGLTATAGGARLCSLSSEPPDFLRAPSGTDPLRQRELRLWAEEEQGWVNTGGIGAWPAPLTSLDVSPDGAWLLLGHGGALELWAADAVPSLEPGAAGLPAYERVKRE